MCLMARLLLVAVALLVFVPAAQAKGPFQVCGASGCAELAPETQPWPVRQSLAPGTSTHRAATPPSYYEIRWGHGTIGVWVPSAGALLLDQSWVAPLDGELALLREKTVGVTPYTPPKHAVALVDWDRVRNGDGYLKLVTVGTPVAAAPTGTRWVDVRVMVGITPWNDGLTALSIARTGYLMRDGQVFRISSKLAKRVLARLPL
jgi:hypothetical protein